MKLIALVSTLLFSVSGFAQIPDLSDTLTHVKVNGQPSAYVAQLVVSPYHDTIELKIFNDICGKFAPPQPGVFRCMAMPSLVTNIKVQVSKTYKNCGSSVYEGTSDDTRIDGTLKSLQLTDHSTRLCRDIVPSPLMIEAKVTNVQTGSTVTYSVQK